MNDVTTIPALPKYYVIRGYNKDNEMLVTPIVAWSINDLRVLPLTLDRDLNDRINDKKGAIILTPDHQVHAKGKIYDTVDAWTDYLEKRAMLSAEAALPEQEAA